eukprot:946226-Amphidinium_carterae.1
MCLPIGIQDGRVFVSVDILFITQKPLVSKCYMQPDVSMKLCVTIPGVLVKVTVRALRLDVGRLGLRASCV